MGPQFACCWAQHNSEQLMSHTHCRRDGTEKHTQPSTTSSLSLLYLSIYLFCVTLKKQIHLRYLLCTVTGVITLYPELFINKTVYKYRKPIHGHTIKCGLGIQGCPPNNSWLLSGYLICRKPCAVFHVGIKSKIFRLVIFSNLVFYAKLV